MVVSAVITASMPSSTFAQEFYLYIVFWNVKIFAQSGLFALPRMLHSFAPLIGLVLIYKFGVLLVVFLAKSVLFGALAPKVDELLHVED